MMKKLPAVLFLSGLVIQLFALFGEHAEEIPFVLKVVAPSYYHARIGVETFQKKRKLTKADDGFEEFSKILIRNAYEVCNTPKNHVLDWKVESISAIDAFVSENKNGKEETYTADDVCYTVITVTNNFTDGSGHFSKSSDFKYHLKAIQDANEELKKPNIMRFCFGLFFVGCAVEIIAFLLECSEANKAGKIEHHHKTDSAESCKNEECK